MNDARPRLRTGRGLQREVVTGLAWVVLAGLAVVGFGVSVLSVRGVEREAAERLRLGALQLERLSSSGPGRLADAAALVRALPRDDLATQWWVARADGRLLGRSLPGIGEAPEAWRALAPEQRTRPALLHVGLPPRDLVLVAPLRGQGGEEGVLLGRVSRGILLARAAPVLGAVAWGFAFTAAIFVSFGAWLLRRRIVLPVQALSRAARGIAQGDLAVRIAVEGTDEVSELGEHFNRMAESLERERGALLEAQRQLLQGERLAAAGRLASGVAHEVGNPVAAILAYGEVVLRDPDLSPRTREAQERAREEALRIRSLIRELLDLGRSSRLDLGVHRPGDLLERAAERLRGQPLVRDVELVVCAEADVEPVRVDAVRVEQALVNLIENACHALAGVRAPRIELRARAAECTPTPQRRREDSPRVALEVVDNGPGIDPEHLPHVFEPFFTTKDPGLGTGLGLWNAHRMAELLGGSLEVESGPGHTRFSLLLPAADS